jgi:AbiJ-like protein
MKKFSERYGYTKVRDSLQIESMDKPLQNHLWSLLERYYWSESRAHVSSAEDYLRKKILPGVPEPLTELCWEIWVNYFENPIDSLELRIWSGFRRYIRNYYFSAEWYQVYDFIEFIPTKYPTKKTNKVFRESCNIILKRKMSSYRFVDDKIAPIINVEEINSIEEAIESETDSVSAHLNRALELFSDRKSPDFRNSIKESISAVESLVIQITGKKGNLSKLLKELEDRFDLHKSLRNSFEKLYGYTSDEDGIRHALTQNPKADFDDARFMLVTCSAFVNYVRGKLHQEQKQSDSETSSE